MPEFLYTIIFFTVFLWSGFGFLLFAQKPESFPSIFIFLILLFGALAFSFSIPYYFRARKKTTLSAKQIYRRGLRWGVYFSFLVTIALGLKAFDLINIVSGILFVLCAVSFYFRVKKR